ncbi:hypothetical protein ACFVS2_20265 [Brevibacillus sp. NPDC058079]|uniref:hypothetical protein n=1 Tax=Brevibacillus sp. NPDC058079 TaxID=3346330 RepID=UPI0036E57359
MFAPCSIEKGWHYNARFNVYQKVNGRVFVYVSKMMFGSYMVQLYLRGSQNMGVCQLEARTSNPAKLEKMFEMGEKWLKDYQEGNLNIIHQDTFSISNPDGVWGRDVHLKKYWIE